MELLVQLYCSCYTKLLVSITTDQLACSGLIAGENDSLGGREPENGNDNSGRCSLDSAVVNLLMKCDGRLEVYHECIKMYIFMFKHVDRVHGSFLQYAIFKVVVDRIGYPDR